MTLTPDNRITMDRQDVIKALIRFYDTKAQARRLLLIADTTDKNELVCFNITSKKQDKENENYPGNAFIAKSEENRLHYDS